MSKKEAWLIVDGIFLGAMFYALGEYKTLMMMFDVFALYVVYLTFSEIAKWRAIIKEKRERREKLSTR